MKPPKPNLFRQLRSEAPHSPAPLQDTGCPWTELTQTPELKGPLNCREDDTVFLRLVLPMHVGPVGPSFEFVAAQNQLNPSSNPKWGPGGHAARSRKNHMKAKNPLQQLADDQAAQYTAWGLLVLALLVPVPVAHNPALWAWILPATWLGLLGWVWSRSR